MHWSRMYMRVRAWVGMYVCVCMSVGLYARVCVCECACEWSHKYFWVRDFCCSIINTILYFLPRQRHNQKAAAIFKNPNFSVSRLIFPPLAKVLFGSIISTAFYSQIRIPVPKLFHVFPGSLNLSEYFDKT